MLLDWELTVSHTRLFVSLCREQKGSWPSEEQKANTLGSQEASSEKQLRIPPPSLAFNPLQGPRRP